MKKDEIFSVIRLILAPVLVIALGLVLILAEAAADRLLIARAKPLDA